MHVGIAYPRWRGKVPGIPGACAPAILRIWQETHVTGGNFRCFSKRPLQERRLQKGRPSGWPSYFTHQIQYGPADQKTDICLKKIFQWHPVRFKVAKRHFHSKDTVFQYSDWLQFQQQYVTLTHWSRDKMAAIFQTTFSKAFSWMKMYEFRLRFH